jgi:hypothetical protein
VRRSQLDLPRQALISALQPLGFGLLAWAATKLPKLMTK